MTDALAETNADEIICAEAELEDGSTQEVQLRARLNPHAGGLTWAPVEGASAADPATISMLRYGVSRPDAGLLSRAVVRVCGLDALPEIGSDSRQLTKFLTVSRGWAFASRG